MIDRLQRRWLDIGYWLFVTPFITGMLTRLATLAAFALLASFVERPTLSIGFWAELPLALLLADLAGYWSHRLRHCGFLWYFHTIHHSPTKLDALAAARMHPVDDLLDNTWVGVVLFLSGFSPQVIVSIGPILFVHIALTHANRGWDFGPLRRVLVSPAQHRAHHEIGADRNYAGMFSFIDVVFGTYEEGRGRPHGSGEAIPDRLFDHLFWPARKLRRRTTPRAE